MAGQQPKTRFDSGFKAGSSSDPTRPLQSTDLIIIDRAAEQTPSESTRIATIADIFTDMAGGNAPFTGTVVIPVDGGAPTTLDFVNGLLVDLVESGGHGTGTAEDPFLVDSVARLIAVNYDLTAHYRQTADINLAGVDWIPIGQGPGLGFKGVYDGGGFSIFNLAVNVAGETEYAGLFKGLYNAVVTDLSIVQCMIKGYRDVGGLAGVATGTTIERCFVSGSVESTGFSAGGIAGTGGHLSAFIDCAVTASVIGISGVGGIRGGVGTQTTFTNCIAYGLIIGNAAVGGIAGYGTNIATSCYWDTETTGQPTSAGGVGKTTAQMKQQATYLGWDFVNVWEINEGIDYPKLRR